MKTIRKFVFQDFVLTRGSFCLPSQGWGGVRGDHFGTILLGFYNFGIKYENHTKSVFVRSVLPRGSFCYLAGDGEGSGGPF